MHCAPWSTEKPKSPGWYWWHRLEELKTTKVVRVSQHGNRLLFEMPGDDSLYELDDFDAQWIGPLDEPQA